MAEFHQSAPLSLEDAVKRVLNKYSDFSGRASRAEFWWWMLAVWVVNIVLGTLGYYVNFIEWISWIFSIAVLVPTLAVSWRRLHDTGRAGGWWFINLIPVVGTIIFIILCIGQLQPQPNRFGDVPVN